MESGTISTCSSGSGSRSTLVVSCRHPILATRNARLIAEPPLDDDNVAMIVSMEFS